MDLQGLFNIRHKTAVITGGSGVLGRAMASGLAQAGVRVAIVSLHIESAEAVAQAIRADGDQAIGIACNVLDRISLEQAQEQVRSVLGPVDILINAAGGNNPHATTTAERPFFDLDSHAVREVLDLNFMGTFQSCQVFGHDMAEQERAASSMSPP